MADLTFEEFASRLGGRLGIEGLESTNPALGLYDDLGLDSLQAFSMLIIVENMADSLVPLMEIPALFTIGDAYSYYQKLRAAVLAESDL